MIYLLQVSCCWALFYSIYVIFLRNETFHTSNRAYLLISLTAGLVVPVLAAYLPANGTSTEVYQAMATIAVVQDIPVTVAQKTTLTWHHVLGLGYALGVILAASRLAYGIYRIYCIFRSGTAKVKDNYTLVQSSMPHLPFSFFHYVFVSDSVTPRGDITTILQHEQLHVSQWHSADILYTELLQCLFWFNPMLIYYKRALKQSHEYLADAYVTNTCEKYSYGQLLLGQSTSGLEIALANQFFNSQIKKRIKMMYKEKSSKWSAIKYAALLPLVVLACLVFSSHMSEPSPKEEVIQSIEDYFTNAASFESTEIIGLYGGLREVHPQLEEFIQTEIHKYSPYRGTEFTVSTNGEKGSCIHTEPASKQNASDVLVSSPSTASHSTRDTTPDVYKVVEEMPMFPGCEQENDKIKKHDCAREALFNFIYENVQYPAEAREKEIEGMVVVQFIVGADGSIRDEKLLRNIGGGCGEEALRVVRSFPTWVPGLQNKKPVNVQYVLPVRYKLADDTSDKTQMQVPTTKEEATDDVDKMALYPGTTTKEDSQQALLTKVYSTVRYPAEARDSGTEGMVVVQFHISSAGIVSDPKILRSLGYGTDEEILRVITELIDEGPWTPAYKDGKAVAMDYTLPVKFKLAGDSADSTPPITNLKAYPNPTNGSFTVSFDSASEEPITLQVISPDGRLLEVFGDTNITMVGDVELAVDVRDKVTPGILSVVLQQGGETYSTKVMVQK